jgi:hypothetical protein
MKELKVQGAILRFYHNTRRMAIIVNRMNAIASNPRKFSLDFHDLSEICEYFDYLSHGPLMPVHKTKGVRDNNLILQSLLNEIIEAGKFLNSAICREFDEVMSKISMIKTEEMRLAVVKHKLFSDRVDFETKWFSIETLNIINDIYDDIEKRLTEWIGLSKN